MNTNKMSESREMMRRSLMPVYTSFIALEYLIGSEYHQDPEWVFLKGKDGKTMTEEEYLRDTLFETEWTVEMLEELVVDIEGLLELSDQDLMLERAKGLNNNYTNTGNPLGFRSWLTNILNLAKQKIEERR